MRHRICEEEHLAKYWWELMQPGRHRLGILSL